MTENAVEGDVGRRWSMARLGEPGATKAAVRARAEEVAAQFEEIFVQQFVAGLRSTTAIGESDGLFGKGPGADTYTRWFDEHFAEHVIRNGGVGVRDILLSDWERIGQIPTAAAAKETVDVEA